MNRELQEIALCRLLLPTANELRILSKRRIVDYAIRCAGLVRKLKSADFRKNRCSEEDEKTFRNLPDASDESLERVLKTETASSMEAQVSGFLAEASIFAFVDNPFYAFLLSIDLDKSLERTVTAARAVAFCALAATGLASKRTASESDQDDSDLQIAPRAETASYIAMQDFIAEVHAEYRRLLAMESKAGAVGDYSVN